MLTSLMCSFMSIFAHGFCGFALEFIPINRFNYQEQFFASGYKASAHVMGFFYSSINEFNPLSTEQRYFFWKIFVILYPLSFDEY